MTDNAYTNEVSSNREEIAAAFGRELDPLAKFAPVFEGFDPFVTFEEEVLDPEGLAPKTRKNYDTTYRQFKAFMIKEGQHPACPNEDYVRAFLTYEREVKGNATDTLKQKLRRLNRCYRYWQADEAFPHPADYNPFELAKTTWKFESDTKKKKYDIPLSVMREKAQEITHIRDRAIWVLQLKHLLRATPMCNLRIDEVNLTSPEVEAAYPDMGTSPYVSDTKWAAYYPPNPNSDAPEPGRQGNKSKRAKLLPLDDETRRVLREWLLVRPTCSAPEVFVSPRGKPLRKADVLKVWKEHFRPEYDEDELHSAVDSHYGRHWSSTYFRVKREWPMELIKVMRGDKIDGKDNEAVYTYIHARYPDIEERYRAEIFKLGV